MHYYKRHLGDYAKDTRHLTMLQHGAFTLLLDWYYSSERPLPPDRCERIANAGTPAEREAVQFVLRDFFTETPEGWISRRADREIAAMQEKTGSAAKSAKARWDKVQAMRTHSERNANAERTQSERNASHKPLSTIQEPEKKDQEQDHAPASPALTLEPVKAKEPKRKREGEGVRLPDGWEPDGAVYAWARAEVPGISPLDQLGRFRDYWNGIPGARGKKSDWQGTFRNWLRKAHDDLIGKRGGAQPQQSHSRAAGRPLE